MDKGLYSHKGKFFLLAYSPSHSELVFRHVVKGGKENIDVFFKGVQHLDVNPKFTALTISITQDVSLRERMKVEDSFSVFTITTGDGCTYYVVAYFFCVFKNKLGLLESPLGDFVWSADNELLFDSYAWVE